MGRLGLQRLRIQAWLLLGNGALLVGGAAFCALPPLLYFYLPGASGVLAGLLALPAAVFGVVMLKVPFARRDAASEDGIRLQPGDAPALFAELDRIRAALDAPPLDAVYLNDAFNASIRQHRVLGGKTRNVLWLGLPLLDTLTPRACSAILAHECAHIAQRHGRYASSVYFARLQWQEVERRLHRNPGLASAPLRLFVGWYVPRFLAVSLAFARACEYQADAQAARVCGVPAMSEALVSLALQLRALRDGYWPSVWRQAAQLPPEDLRPFQHLATAGPFESPTDSAEAASWLHDALCQPTDPTDTHPSLADRLAALGAAPDAPGAELHWQRAQPSAAEAWLQHQHLPLAARLDAASAEHHAHLRADAAHAREQRLSDLHDLQRKQRIRSLSANETAWLADVHRMLGIQPERVVPLLQEALRLAPDDMTIHTQLADALAQAGQTDAAAALWRAAATQPGPWQPVSLRRLSVLAMRAQDEPEAAALRRQADRLQRAHAESAESGRPDQYTAHDLSTVEAASLADTLDPLLRVASGVWLLRDGGSQRYLLLIQARESPLLRMVGRLTGEQNYRRRDCERLLPRLLPRVRLDVEAAFLDPADARLAWCVDAARITARAPA